ncbi:MAG: hypothetical protein AB2598_05185 [Candidatus Thiodiazotropha sp.]
MSIFFAVGGLLIFALVLASLAHRYHAYVEERRQHVQRILKRVDEIDRLVQRMVGLPVPAEMERILRRDILARLQAAKGIHGRYPGIDGMLSTARQALDQAAPRAASVEMNEQKIERFTRLMGELEWLLKENRLLVEINEEEKEALLGTLVMRQTETLHHYHLGEAKRLLQGNQLHQALWHCEQVKLMVKGAGFSNDELEGWYQEADRLHGEVTQLLSGV